MRNKLFFKVYKNTIKRLFDLMIAVLSVMILSPLFILVGILVRIKIGSPVLFKQKRPGLHGKPFTIYKFRTMTDERDGNGALLPDGERLTRIGRFLRKTSMDELPELFNVLKGDMSIVGPRPLLMRYYPYFTDEEKIRFSVLPGITGLSQVSGRNDLPWDKRIATDLQYVYNYSFNLDIWILLMTVRRVITRHGLRVDPGKTMIDFDEERRQRLKNTQFK